MNAYTRAGASAVALATSIVLTATPSQALHPEPHGGVTGALPLTEHPCPVDGAVRTADMYQRSCDSQADIDDEFVKECLRPLEGITRFPDVYQGWIDGCRDNAVD